VISIHKPRRNWVSIPYKRVTNFTAIQAIIDFLGVSIPYKRVTNLAKVNIFPDIDIEFQSPISGSQTEPRMGLDVGRV